MHHPLSWSTHRDPDATDAGEITGCRFDHPADCHGQTSCIVCWMRRRYTLPHQRGTISVRCVCGEDEHEQRAASRVAWCSSELCEYIDQRRAPQVTLRAPVVTRRPTVPESTRRSDKGRRSRRWAASGNVRAWHVVHVRGARRCGRRGRGGRRVRAHGRAGTCAGRAGRGSCGRAGSSPGAAEGGRRAAGRTAEEPEESDPAAREELTKNLREVACFELCVVCVSIHTPDHVSADVNMGRVLPGAGRVALGRCRGTGDTKNVHPLVKSTHRKQPHASVHSLLRLAAEALVAVILGAIFLAVHAIACAAWCGCHDQPRAPRCAGSDRRSPVPRRF